MALRKDLFPASAKKFQSAFNRINAVIDEQTFRGTQAEDFSYCFATPPHNDYVPANNITGGLQPPPPLWEQFPNAIGTGCFNGWYQSQYHTLSTPMPDSNGDPIPDHWF
ncbi:MAG: hypothetical protein LBU65_17060 [Planctomycetaceae bacterium]|nr:hypothetical protein [Planctomycetaceae bacterium]